jgi:membrane-bound metal-dependent hydrolase YbcI (DUF457 family)
MLGRSHALSGGAAYAALGQYVWHLPPGYLATGTAIAIGAAVLPDLDTVGSSAARSLGWVSEGLAWVVHRISGGHREGTHTAVGDVICALLAVAAIVTEGVHFRVHLGLVSHELSAGRLVLAFYLALLFGAGMKALKVLRRHGKLRELAAIAGGIWLAWSGFDAHGIAWAILLGTAVHAAGDALTKHGVAWLEPFSSHVFHLLPEHMRLSTGHFTERKIIAPGFVLALGFLSWHAASLPLPTL